MTGIEIEWFEYYESNYPSGVIPELRVGNTLRPKTLPVRTGCVIIIGKEEGLYKVMTDFGNVQIRTKEELLKDYEVMGYDDDLVGRISHQVSKLQDCLNDIMDQQEESSDEQYN